VIKYFSLRYKVEYKLKDVDKSIDGMGVIMKPRDN